jgi:hypothetical protein
MSIATANSWRRYYAQEQLRHQQQAIAKGEPLTLSPSRRAKLTADQKFKAYLEDIAACFLDFHPGAWIPAADLYTSLVWPAPVPINYRRFVKLFCEAFPEIRAVEKDCNGVRRIVFTGVERRRS